MKFQTRNLKKRSIHYSATLNEPKIEKSNESRLPVHRTVIRD